MPPVFKLSLIYLDLRSRFSSCVWSGRVEVGPTGWYDGERYMSVKNISTGYILCTKKYIGVPGWQSVKHLPLA